MTNSKVHKVLVVDDHALMRNGLEAMLNIEPDYDVVGVAGDGKSAMRAATELQPDIITMDLTTPRSGGIDAIARIKRQHPHIKIVILTFHKEDEYIFASLKAGADAYVLKDDSRNELFAALTGVMQGRSYLSPSIVDKVPAGYVRDG